MPDKDRSKDTNLSYLLVSYLIFYERYETLLPMSTMTEVIQKARRFIGYEYSQSVTKSACAAATENQVDDDDAPITKADKETIMAIDQRMVQLNKALIEYDAQHEQPPKKRNSV